MTMAPRLGVSQRQSLAMTPQLQQAIRLLTLSNVELDAFLTEAVARNPLLEIETGRGDDGADTENIPVTRGETGGDGHPGAFKAAGFDADGPAHAAYADGAASTGRPAAPAPEDDFDRFCAPDASLGDCLAGQARARFSGPLLAIILHLVAHLDPAGYLDGDLAAIAARLGIGSDDAQAALAALQSLDPPGIGARDLAECLTLQAIDADRHDPCMAALIANLDLVARGRLRDLKRLCAVDDDDLRDMLRELRGYDPKPGLRFASEPLHSITPDLFVSREADGWRIIINDATLPRVLVDRSYRAHLPLANQRGGGRQDSRTHVAAKEAGAWLNACASEAQGLLRALDQRQRTIVSVTREIVRRQEGFFLYGVTRLKALTQQEVADTLGLHETTVSRAAANKYLACARGTFALRYFFTSGVSDAGGETAAADAVKAAIRGLIDGERADAILSDDAIVAALQKGGYAIARRTVAKYREAMGLGSSVERRRRKMLDGAG